MQADDLLERASVALRAPVPVRPAWREALLRDIAAAPRPDVVSSDDTAHLTKRTRWTIHPLAALAAAVGFIAIGLTAGILMSRSELAAPALTANGTSQLTTVRFVIVAPAARQVSLVGDFNAWNAAANPMQLSRDGQTWVSEVPLAPGRHTYAFVVDGDVLKDPAAPSLVDDDFGVPNSIIFVGDSRT